MYSKLNLIFILMLILTISVDAFNPYDVLGVKRRASVAEIKKSYKSLVRVLHPDKNKDTNAENKFIELNKAYELLMDPERRQEYDRTGVTEDSPNFRQRPDYSSFKRFDFDPFESAFGSGAGSGQQFHFNFNGANVFHKLTITTRAYENNIVGSSYSRPYLILFYGDLCFACFQMESLWQKIVNDMEPSGVGFVTIHSQHESQLARKLGVETLPYIISLVDGQTRNYKDPQISLAKIIEFIRRSLPKDLVVEVTDENYLEFLNGWHDNRVRTLFVNEEHIIKLRYLLVAFEFRDRIAFAHVTADDSARQICTRYRVDHKMNSMLIFNEDITRTTATLSVSELKPQLMRDVLESNKFLLLPRLASQAMFDQLCPAESVRSRRRLCIVLVTNNIPEHESKRESMREFMRQNNYPKERFRFMYLFGEKQPEFVKALTIGANTPVTTTLHVVVLWRRELDRVFYEWLPNGWDMTDDKRSNETKVNLSNLLTKLVQNSEQFTNDAKVMNLLIDESVHGLFGKIVKKILIITDNLSDNITRKEVLPAVTIVLTISFIVFIGYIMAYLVRIEEETIKEKYKRMGKQMPGVGKSKNDCKLNIHELRGETYNGLVRLLKPGCRTVVLLVDTTSKPKLLPQFYRALYPYRRNKTLMFAFLYVEKNLDWYRKLLMQTLGEHKELQINPKNCIGTVISLNGFRKYFCVYHAKHPERKPREGPSGAFMGFDEDSNDSETDIECGNTSLIHRQTGDIDDEIVFEEHLLDGLSNWLDRLFEGSTQRYHIQYWPEHMK